MTAPGTAERSEQATRDYTHRLQREIETVALPLGKVGIYDEETLAEYGCSREAAFVELGEGQGARQPRAELREVESAKSFAKRGIVGLKSENTVARLGERSTP